MIAQVISNRNISGKYYEMELRCPELTVEIKPGQFFMLRVREGYDPYLRRPFSVYRVNHRKGISVTGLLYKVVGQGTQIMSEIERGEKVDIMGPLGNGFEIPSRMKTALLVAGGIGLPPVLFLAEAMRRRFKGREEIIFFYGGQSQVDIVDLDRIQKSSTEVKICTEDGSMGSRMLVTEPLEEYLQSGAKTKTERESTMIFACGPKGMLKAVASIAKRYDVPCQMSLESYMACGFGACLGCVVRVRSKEHDGVAHERVCKEGPIFDAERIMWDE
jgi:dihydroorotate dehydrogenase electron transfer subunit